MLFGNTFDIEVEITVETLAKGLGDLFFILVNVNPLKFFGIISLAFFVAGIYPASQVLYEKLFTGEIVHIPSAIFSSLLFVTGTISIVLGIVSELIVRSRRRVEYLINKKFDLR